MWTGPIRQPRAGLARARTARSVPCGTSGGRHGRKNAESVMRHLDPSAGMIRIRFDGLALPPLSPVRAPRETHKR